MGCQLKFGCPLFFLCQLKFGCPLFFSLFFIFPLIFLFSFFLLFFLQVVLLALLFVPIADVAEHAPWDIQRYPA